jgi:hypothetical protein
VQLERVIARAKVKLVADEKMVMTDDEQEAEPESTNS